ncbi:hypothetical protein B0T14DRAFT_558797 [Immersiella caudata]|uniref:Uncharacterized protein n=1 Tax=Immersiella caudata TaxID=314043 RepID=A0AA39U6F8_9PEZI|nr:hypothetical protein B0T14DRAFT_558797 [Immersiella caudata]
MDMAWLNFLDILPFELVSTDGFPRLDDNALPLFDYVPRGRAETVIPVLLAAVMSNVHFAFAAFEPSHLMCVSTGVPVGEGCLEPDRNGVGPVVYGTPRPLPAEEAALPENQLQIQIKIEEDAYGYSFEGTAIVLAFIFLCLRVLLVLAHLAIIAIKGFWSSTAWANWTDFIVLGIGSAPSDLLQNTSAGVGSWRSWLYLASVRSAKRQQRLELVICDPETDQYHGLLGREKAHCDANYL